MHAFELSWVCCNQLIILHFTNQVVVFILDTIGEIIYVASSTGGVQGTLAICPGRCILHNVFVFIDISMYVYLLAT